MIEITFDIIHTIVAAVCTAVAFYRAVEVSRKIELDKTVAAEEKASALKKAIGRREWILLGLFTGEYFLGDLYSLLYLIFYDRTPMYFIADISWYVSYLFLILLILYVSDRHSIRMITRWQLIIPLFTIGMGVFFVMTSGDILGNIVAVVIMTIAIWLPGGALEREKQEMKAAGYEPGKQTDDEGNPSKYRSYGKCFFYRMCLIVLAIEYGFWITSSFWLGDTIINPYFWMGAFSSVSFIVMIPAVKRAVEATRAEKEAKDE